MTIKTRFLAFLVHLSISIVVALVAAALVFFVLYPDYLPGLSGVGPLFTLMLVVDVVLGPVITFIVFDRRKKELTRDLIIVGVIQFAALFYGVHTLYIARPVYIVFNVDRFDVIYANDLTEERLAKVQDPHFQRLPAWGVVMIAARRPADPKARQEILFNALSGGDDLKDLPQHYVPYSQEKNTVVAKLKSLDDLEKFNPNQLGKVAAVKSMYPNYAATVGYLPLKGKTGDLVVIVDKKTAKVLAYVPLQPW